ncbi:hybrid sensor histidine kinase/response regulator transcription factor [Gramella sp. AN32]|uniref:histidine kinase n=1 Tax=Christiangramia antarctica TaxID=2058158 RepID=A0ABW5X3Z1_9FLAO|nr:hybrid sensor histidine kinase/response regulator transcription factor [Gramella sp. AN32]MCM4155796.1 hypothetical protein [Gramella sp. AN32]
MNSSYKHLFLIVWLFHLILVGAHGQNSNKPSLFHELQIDGNVFNKKTNVTFEDSMGFLWIGTNSGLYRYDGYNLKKYQYDVFDENSLPNNNINSIAEDKNQNLWLGSESYLIFYNRKKNTFKGFFKNKAAKVLLTTDNSSWCSLGKTGLFKIKISTNPTEENFCEIISYNGNDFQINQVSFMLNDIHNRKWIGSPEGIFLLKDGKLIPTNIDWDIRELKYYSPNSFLAVTKNGVSILEYEKNGAKLEILEIYSNFLSKSNSEALPTSVAINPENKTVWLGSTKGLYRGIRQNNQYSWNYINKSQVAKNSLLSDHIYSTNIDSYGNLWIGTLKGVNKYIGRNSVFEYHPLPDNLENDFVHALYSINQNNLLIGLEKNGLHLYNIKKKRFLKSPIKNTTEAIKKDHLNEGFYISSNNHLLKTGNISNQGILEFDTIKSYQRSVKDILPVNNNKIWVGLWSGGMDIVNTATSIGEFENMVIKALKQYNISVLMRDSHGNIWIGTRGEGLYFANTIDETLQSYLPSKESGLTSNAILCLLEDETGNIWIGTRGGGLNVLNKTTGQFKSYSIKEGLNSSIISAMEIDNKGHLWLSTQNGLSRFNIKEEKFLNFGTEDGVTETQFIFNSSAVDRGTGDIYFGSTDGFYSIHTQDFSQTNLEPKTVITSFNVLGTAAPNNTSMNAETEYNINDTTLLELPYNNNNLSIKFSSLDLTAPNKNRFAYRLEGLNDYWIYTTAADRNVNYHDLAPGDYTFKVKSSNSDGIWNNNPATFSFRIHPPVWLSPIAILIYFLVIIGIISIAFVLIRRWYRLKKHLVAETISRQKDNELNRMKMVFFTDISHELRTPLTLIMGTIEKIIADGTYKLSPLTAKRIHGNSLRMKRLINHIMDIRKYDVGKFKLKVSKSNIIEDIQLIKNAFNDFARIYHIQYKLKSDYKHLKAWYDEEILEKILFNLLSNAFKYTPEKGEILITVTRKEGHELDYSDTNFKPGKYIECSIRDNGCGISKKDMALIFDRYYQATNMPSNQIPGTGIGMELVYKLVENHHGAIKVESEENNFTEFTFVLPKQKSHYKKTERVKKSANYIRKKLDSELLLKSPDTPEVTGQTSDKSKWKLKVLLVEDNQELRRMMKEELLNLYVVLEASNGEEGYNLALQEKPNLIVSDILMPVTDGITMLKKIKATREINHIPVFMLTARDSHEVKLQCLELGADDYIEKPFSLEFVKWKIKNTLESRRVLKEKFSKVISTEPSTPEFESNDEKFIKKLIVIIEESMDDNLLSVEYLASEVGMSRANLYRKLQAILNETPVNFIKQIKLKRAKQLLQKNSLYISEIAYMTGFKSQKYFSKCFHKEYGMSPSDYAKKFTEKTLTEN